MLDVLVDRRESSPEAGARREHARPAVLIARSMQPVAPHAQGIEAEVRLRAANGVGAEEAVATRLESGANECAERRDGGAGAQGHYAVPVLLDARAGGSEHVRRDLDR